MHIITHSATQQPTTTYLLRIEQKNAAAAAASGAIVVVVVCRRRSHREHATMLYIPNIGPDSGSVVCWPCPSEVYREKSVRFDLGVRLLCFRVWILEAAQCWVLLGNV